MKQAITSKEPKEDQEQTNDEESNRQESIPKTKTTTATTSTTATTATTSKTICLLESDEILKLTRKKKEDSFLGVGNQSESDCPQKLKAIHQSNQQQQQQQQQVCASVQQTPTKPTKIATKHKNTKATNSNKEINKDDNAWIGSATQTQQIPESQESQESITSQPKRKKNTTKKTKKKKKKNSDGTKESSDVLLEANRILSLTKNGMSSKQIIDSSSRSMIQMEIEMEKKSETEKQHQLSNDHFIQNQNSQANKKIRKKTKKKKKNKQIESSDTMYDVEAPEKTSLCRTGQSSEKDIASTSTNRGISTSADSNQVEMPELQRQNRERPSEPGAVAVTGIGGSGELDLVGIDQDERELPDNSNSLMGTLDPFQGTTTTMATTTTTTTTMTTTINGTTVDGMINEIQEEYLSSVPIVTVRKPMTGSNQNRRTNLFLYISIGIFFVGIVVIVLLIVLLLGPGDNNNNNNNKLKESDTTIQGDNDKGVWNDSNDLLQFLYDQVGNFEGGSHQYQAYKWLAELYEVGSITVPLNDNPNNDDLRYDILEQFSLATLYFATNGSSWYNNERWLSATTTTPCEWFGSNGACSNYMKELVLVNNNLWGTIPTEMGLLTKLTVLRLEGNVDLTGSVPSELGALVDLENLCLDNTRTATVASTEFTKWKNIRKMSFDRLNATREEEAEFCDFVDGRIDILGVSGQERFVLNAHCDGTRNSYCDCCTHCCTSQSCLANRRNPKMIEIGCGPEDEGFCNYLP